jgi:hypothetical protein
MDEDDTVTPDDAGFEPVAAPLMEPPPVAAPLPPPPSVSPVATSSPSKRRFPWVTVVVGVVAVAAIVVLSLMFVSAANDRDDADEALAEAQHDLDAAADDLADSEAALADSEAALASAESDLSDTEAALADTETALADTEAARDEAEAAQAEAEAARDEQEQRADEYEAASAAFLAVTMGEGLGLDDGDAECLGQGLIDSLGADALGSLANAAAAADPDAEVAAFGVEMLRIAEDCGIDPDALDDPSSTDPFAYGDDPELDALYDECAAGDAVACDDLYIDSPTGSEYELFGGTCGGRFEYSDTESCEGRL